MERFHEKIIVIVIIISLSFILQLPKTSLQDVMVKHKIMISQT